jgi:hypothetical protein
MDACHVLEKKKKREEGSDVRLNSPNAPAPCPGGGPRAPRQLCHSALRCLRSSAQSHKIQESNSWRVPLSADPVLTGWKGRGWQQGEGDVEVMAVDTDPQTCLHWVTSTSEHLSH